jgi:hypothetical protein
VRLRVRVIRHNRFGAIAVVYLALGLCGFVASFRLEYSSCASLGSVRY